VVRIAFGGLLAALALLLASGASAKDFKPGDLRICNAKRCVAIVDEHVLPTVGEFYYADGSPPRSRPPRMDARAYELRFTNGYATGIVAGRGLDRFLSYGVNGGRFQRGQWYRVPAKLAGHLQCLATRLQPLHVTRAALAKSR
jgi:hypothetical protein